MQKINHRRGSVVSESGDHRSGFRRKHTTREAGRGGWVKTVSWQIPPTTRRPTTTTASTLNWKEGSCLKDDRSRSYFPGQKPLKGRWKWREWTYGMSTKNWQKTRTTAITIRVQNVKDQRHKLTKSLNQLTIQIPFRQLMKFPITCWQTSRTKAPAKLIASTKVQAVINADKKLSTQRRFVDPENASAFEVNFADPAYEADMARMPSSSSKIR